ncbi:MAG: hypothetical protein AMXMBFR64_34630 [Myxococcales bacterium]
MKLRTLAVSAAMMLVLAALAGCDVTNDSDADGTTGGGGGGGGTTDTGGGGGGGGGAGFGCDDDGYCNGAECALTADPDCNPAASCGEGSCGNNKWDPNCSCNYYGKVCEAISKCSDAVCLCDTDCTPPDGSLKSACVSDGHCDSWCPKDQDPDCAGSKKNGKECAKPSCNKKSGYCNAKPGTTSPCADDPDCTGGAIACEGDGYCDPNCSAGSDPDC